MLLLSRRWAARSAALQECQVVESGDDGEHGRGVVLTFRSTAGFGDNRPSGGSRQERHGTASRAPPLSGGVTVE
jgi:hypothetical protein